MEPIKTRMEVDLHVALRFVIIGIRNGSYDAAIAILEDILNQSERMSKEGWRLLPPPAKAEL